MLTDADGPMTPLESATAPPEKLLGVAVAMGARLVSIGAAARGRGVARASVPTLGAGAHDLREYTVFWAPNSYRQAVCGVESGTRGTATM